MTTIVVLLNTAILQLIRFLRSVTLRSYHILNTAITLEMLLSFSLQLPVDFTMTIVQSLLATFDDIVPLRQSRILVAFQRTDTRNHQEKRRKDRKRETTQR